MIIKKHDVHKLIVTLAFAWAFVVGPSHFEIPTARADDGLITGDTADNSSALVQGELPARMPKVTIDVSNQTVGEALDIVVKQIGYGLVLESDVGARQSQLITLKLKRIPAIDVLEIILRNGHLKAEIKNEIVFVSAAGSRAFSHSASAVAADAGVPSGAVPMTPQPQGQQGKLPSPLPPHGVLKDRVQVGQSLRINADEQVKDAVAVGGDLTVLGHVYGDAVAVGGSVNVEPGAYVRGEAAAVGGSVNVKAGATVEGEQVGIGIPLGGFVDALKKHKKNMDEHGNPIPGLSETFTAFSILGFLLRTVLLFVCCLVVIAIMPIRVATVRAYLVHKPGQSILAGIAVLIALVPSIVLLAITIVGIPLIPVVIVGLPLIMLFGLTALLSWFGFRLPIFTSKKGQLLATAIGVVIFMLVGLVPFAGPVLLTLAAFASVGAVLLSRFGLDTTKKLPESSLLK